MAVSKFELFHGAVLAQVIRNPGFSLKLFERTDEHGWGEYEINDNFHSYRLLIKATKQVRNGRKGRSYSYFTFSERDVERLRTIQDQLLLCLVCAEKEICTLEWEDLTQLGLLRNREACNIVVTWSSGSELGVKSKFAELPYKIPRNRLKTFCWV